jgi:hypothetical protein
VYVFEQKRVIQSQLLNPLARKIIEGALPAQSRVRVGTAAGALRIDVQPPSAEDAAAAAAAQGQAQGQAKQGKETDAQQQRGDRERDLLDKLTM